MKKRKLCMTLKAYQKNSRALGFYAREGFAFVKSGTDGETGEREVIMEWRP